MYPSKHPRIQLSYKDAGALGWLSKGAEVMNGGNTAHKELIPTHTWAPRAEQGTSDTEVLEKH